jgi:predicted flap endonuclease-1-like 5' DNA nuclease
MSNIRIEFLPSESDGPDLVEIRRVGDPNTVLYKVTEKVEWLEEHFPAELAAYQKSGGQVAAAAIKPRGFELTTLKGVGPRRAQTLINQDVNTVEQLAELSDASVGSLGAGTVDLRKQARDYLAEQSGQSPRQVIG